MLKHFSFLLVALVASFNLFATKTDTLYIKDAADPSRVTYRVVERGTNEIIEEGILLSGKKEGVWRTYFDNHFIATTTEYHNGMKNGLSMTFAGDGTIMKEEMYKNDIKDGWAKTYGRNRKIKDETHYRDGIVSGTQKIYYPDGPLQEWGYFKNAVRDSVNTWYYQSGKMTVQYTYINNNLDGAAKSFYTSGRLKTEGSFANGKENGEWKEYFDSSLVKPEDKPLPEKKTDGAKPGAAKTKTTLLSGKDKPMVSDTYEVGILEADGNYQNGVKQGIWKIYDLQGQLSKTEEYKDGILVKEKKVSK